MMGAGIGAGLAYMLKADKRTLFSSIASGLSSTNAVGWFPDGTIAVAGGTPSGCVVTVIATVTGLRMCAGIVQVCRTL